LKEGSDTLHRSHKSNTSFHPLSVENLTGGVDQRANDSCSSSALSDFALESSAHKFEKIGRKSVTSICLLIDTVKENVFEIEKDFQDDIGE
jgi:hypothetical protein